MIRVHDVLPDMPHFETFCSVEKLHGLVDRLRADPRFSVEIAGTSANGVPIHHLRFGKGAAKALFVAFPHCLEPIGGMTVFSLMTLLQQGNQALLEADVEWHVVPCIDPDGALLNEGWSQKPFTLENYMREVYLQATPDQVDTSFPMTHKKLVWTQPSQEAKILKEILDEIRPDFYFSLHNCWTGGAFYFLSRDIDHKHYREIYELLDRQGFPLQRRPLFRQFCAQLEEGMLEPISVKKYYDYLERTGASPEDLFERFGAHSRDYLAEIKPSALTFTAEMGYVRHPSDESQKETRKNLRRCRLRIDADSKFLATVLLDEWEKVKSELDPESPFYRAILGGGVFPLEKEKLLEGGLPQSFYPTREILFNPEYDVTMREGDLFHTCMVDGGFFFLARSYQFVRLLKGSRQTPAVRQAIERLERAFDDALTEIARYVDFEAFEVIDCNTLARVQLGSGLIALNSILETQSQTAGTSSQSLSAQ